MKTDMRYDPHLMEMNIAQLELIMCEECLVNSMDEYACPNYIQDNEAVCSECCWCHDPEGGGQ